MAARMKDRVMIRPGALPGLLNFSAIATSAGVPPRTIDLVHLRVSQINDCSVCAEMHARELRESGETEARVSAVAEWRESPYFTDAERAALALADSATRGDDRAKPVPGEVWEKAAQYYDETSLAALSLLLE